MLKRVVTFVHMPKINEQAQKQSVLRYAAKQYNFKTNPIKSQNIQATDTYLIEIVHNHKVILNEFVIM